MRKDAKDILSDDLPPLIQSVRKELIDEISKNFYQWFITHSGRGVWVKKNYLIQLLNYLKVLTDKEIQQIARLKAAYAVYLERYSSAETEKERQHHIIALVKDLGSSPASIAADKRAFKRWFGHDAVVERYLNKQAESEHRLAFFVNRLGKITSAIVKQSSEESKAGIWKKINVEETLEPLLTFKGDYRVIVETIKSLSLGIQPLPNEYRYQVLKGKTLQFLYRASLDKTLNVWIQCESLKILLFLSVDSLKKTIFKRLSMPGEMKDDIFVRKCAIVFCGALAKKDPAFYQLLESALKDPSAYVRQAIPEALRSINSGQAIPLIANISLHDLSEQVQVSALLEIIHWIREEENVAELAAILRTVLAEEKKPFVLRAALKVAGDGIDFLSKKGREEQTEQWYSLLFPHINNMASRADFLPLRTWAAKTREQINGSYSSEIKELSRILKPIVAKIVPGKSKRISTSIRKKYGWKLLGRTLSLLAQQDHGLELSLGWFSDRIYRGQRFGFAWWRFFHELCSPSPEKRQGYCHTKGRIFSCSIIAPSGIMGELTKTTVPGEPVHYESESGWREFLPLPDHVLSSVSRGIFPRSVKIFSSQGITVIKPPFNPIRRLLGTVFLNLKFKKYSDLRNWDEASQLPPSGYVRSLSRLGISLVYTPYETNTENKNRNDKITRFFQAGWIFPFSSTHVWRRAEEYFFSVYENSLFELAGFTIAFLLVFIVINIIKSRIMRYWRARIPLVIGGWGTRGKSGTERLKAGLFNALGHSVFTKTTGCEALFLFSQKFRPTNEYFLFRPYDKATIWEQCDMVRLAGKIKADVFLWECMGLNPVFVKVLQQGWMRDDYSTITNTIPDHEDIMGPAGIDIPMVMTGFIPPNSTLLTSEEEMLPILRTGADKAKTKLNAVGWLEAGLITDDILERFSYKEYPHNIALVAALAKELGVDKDFALKEMADNVVPDIGVLKTFPKAAINHRVFEFSNGMSANERYGCLSNWRRVGFDKPSFEDTPSVWITTVVNNRADRIARSQIFAKVIVDDLQADKHFLIGKNLKGLQGFIEKALKEKIKNMSLGLEDKNIDTSNPFEILVETARRMRLPYNEKNVRARLKVMITPFQDHLKKEEVLKCWSSTVSLEKTLTSLNQENKEAIINFHKLNLECMNDFTHLTKKIEQLPAKAKVHAREYRSFVSKWFKKKIFVIADSGISGERIIEIIMKETPPGVLNKIMGIQNIKNTGMDFVHRWQDWEQCFNACKMLSSDLHHDLEKGMGILASYNYFGILTREHIQTTLEKVRHKSGLQNESAQAEIKAIKATLARSAEKGQRGRIDFDQKNYVVRVLLKVIDSFGDTGNAVRKRKKSKLIYKDLVNGRISTKRAGEELTNLKKQRT